MVEEADDSLLRDLPELEIVEASVEYWMDTGSDEDE